MKGEQHEVDSMKYLVSADLSQIVTHNAMFVKPENSVLPVVSQGWWPPRLHFPCHDDENDDDEDGDDEDDDDDGDDDGDDDDGDDNEDNLPTTSFVSAGIMLATLCAPDQISIWEPDQIFVANLTKYLFVNLTNSNRHYAHLSLYCYFCGSGCPSVRQ